MNRCPLCHEDLVPQHTEPYGPLIVPPAGRPCQSCRAAAMMAVMRDQARDAEERRARELGIDELRLVAHLN